MEKNFTQFPVLNTARLTLRQLRDNDDNEIFALRSNESVNKYLDRPPCKSIDDARNFIQTINENIQRNNLVYWAITLSSTGELIGTVCLFNFSQDDLAAETGYELLPAFQGKGFMQEAISSVIQFGLQQVALNSIVANTHSENQRSTNVLEKLNFKREGPSGDSCTLYRLTKNS